MGLEDQMAHYELTSSSEGLPFFLIDCNEIVTPTGEFAKYGIRSADIGVFPCCIPDYTFIYIYTHSHSHRQSFH